jgi:uncharacterized protein YndB with AHSA1/START domain
LIDIKFKVIIPFVLWQDKFDHYKDKTNGIIPADVIRKQSSFNKSFCFTSNSHKARIENYQKPNKLDRKHIMKNTTLTLSFMFLLPILLSCLHAQDGNQLVHEGVVNAPVNQVWAAFTTSGGLESWMTAHAKIELKIGGTMKTQYDPKGTTDDATAIGNTILSYEPMRMLSLKVTKVPDAFPYPKAIKNMWTVIYFIQEGKKATRVREVSLGFTNDDESKRMREFFNRGNAFTLQELQKRFAPKAGTK